MKLLFSTIFSFLTLSFFAQSQIEILDNESKKPILNVKVKHNEKSIFISDALGMVQIPNLKGGDELEFSSKFYKSREIIWASDDRTIYLSKESKTLKDANIVGQRPQVKVEAGKTTLDASNATIQQGTLKDLIQQMPGVILDNNNNISIKGKSGLRVLIDGKTSQLAVIDMKSFLESLPAQSVKSIEILTNPGAQYDAEGKSGIISIKLKKDKKEGFNTKLSGGVGSVLDKYSAGIFSNYKNDKFNIFGNYQFNYKELWYSYIESRQSFLGNQTQYYNYEAYWKDISRQHNAKFGVDLFTDKNTTIGYTFDVNINANNGRNNRDNNSYILDENQNILSKYLATNSGKNLINTVVNGLSFRTSFDSSKIEWSGDISHTYFTEVNQNVMESFAFKPNDESDPSNYNYFEPDLNNHVHNIMAKTDLVVPSKFGKFEFGLKNEANFNQNIYKAYIKDFGQPKFSSDKYQNDFNYNENIFAGYVSLSKAISVLQLDLGLRMENTIISSNNPLVGRQYLNLFPNLGAAMPLDSHTSVSVRYSRRIDRPSFNKLNNRVVYYNRYTANVGVPTLQPEMADVFSLQVDRSYLQGALNLSLGADVNLETNDINEYMYLDSTFTSYFTSGNIGTANLYSSYLNIYFKPSKWYDINLTPMYTFNLYDNNYKGVNTHSEGSAFQLSFQTNINLDKGYKVSLNGWMTSGMIWPQGVSDAFGMVNGSISKSFMNNKLNVELTCSDLFNSNIWTGRQTSGNMRSTGRWKPETRIAWLNFSFNFGKKSNYKRTEIEKSSRIVGGGR